MHLFCSFHFFSVLHGDAHSQIGLWHYPFWRQTAVCMQTLFNPLFTWSVLQSYGILTDQNFHTASHWDIHLELASSKTGVKYIFAHFGWSWKMHCIHPTQSCLYSNWLEYLVDAHFSYSILIFLQLYHFCDAETCPAWLSIHQVLIILCILFIKWALFI